MQPENKVIEVYHAGTDRIEHPLCRKGRKNLDFGQGFYVTDIYDQAMNLAKARAIERKASAKLNIYHLHKDEFLRDGKCLVLNQYDDEWLDFIVHCRAGKDIWKSYDYVEGGVADDRVINTVNLYIQGFISKESALKNLQYLKPNNQICILNQDLLNKYLIFTDCLELKDHGLL
ncbi:MAG: DUF3990 domain-containing protein [Muribaculaceae bacterium]|nr:DUF3990 domain-containing protein [Muribaculaceae bacterium]MDE6836014.1 DUF3990 domain-containing protein [Muribaculaceae bacterium]MDE6866547.1 DUF3990 domain-containing protein [Muribaculaceae bacterium]